MLSLKLLQFLVIKEKIAGVGKITITIKIHIFRADWMFLKTISSSEPSVSRKILTLLHLQAEIAVIH